MTVATLVPRAERAVLRMPMVYRVRGGDEWFQSRIVNISESGILFGPTGLRPGAIVEMMFVRPPQFQSMPSGMVTCKGQIVRTDETDAAGAAFYTQLAVVE
jgi:hypothetical protein